MQIGGQGELLATEVLFEEIIDCQREVSHLHQR